MKAVLQVEPITSWKQYKKRPLVISGPCSAETEIQVLQTARELAASGKVDIFRAGIWKPRTRPGTFEGMGSIALPWLKRVKEETGMGIATEVANAKHVYEALKYGVDHIWIGARSTANPFVVQEISDALEGSDVTVLVKNPINPELELWFGAIERLKKAGITRIGAIHRGFSSYEKTAFRNTPHWLIPVELKQRIENLPLICDPSHICGNRHMLLEVSQKAMDLNFDGLMLESHTDPSVALSDAAQQVTPRMLTCILDRLVMRSPESNDTNFLNVLEELRGKIDIYDEQLIEILERRMNVAKNIALYKKENNITILQSRRWAEVVRKNLALGEKKGLSNSFVNDMLRLIHQESINQQNQVMNEGSTSSKGLEEKAESEINSTG
ncbi:MAG: chorismate mutase [Bacteroides sp.]|jgi:3-deoxy-7-phosphoheptulonate synthase|nr:chorismate mutase [Bacteroides sp.]